MSGELHAAVLGLGIIGSRVADRLHAAGTAVRTWNRTPRGRPEETGAAADALPDSGWVCLFLRDGPAVREVATAVRERLHPGLAVLNHSTVDPGTTRWLAELAADAGAGFLDLPFTGSRVAAERGELVYYAGGDPELLERARPLLELSARAIVPVGAVGDATVVKLATNLVAACTVEALAEALAIATRAGVPADRFTEAVAHNACHSPLTAMKLPAMAAGEFDTHFSLANMCKDGRYAARLAEQLGIEAPAARMIVERMGSLCEAGHGDLDYSALALGSRS